VADWVVDQYQFEQAYLARRGGAERRRVKLLWWPAAPRRRTDATTVLARLLSPRAARRAGAGLVTVAVFDATDPVGAEPFLVLPAEPGGFAEPQGRATGTLVGSSEPGGTLVIEVGRATVLPAAPPGTPDDDAPTWSELGPPPRP
jgi:hypothetical protein